MKTKRQQEKRPDVWRRAKPARKEGRKSSTCFRHPAISWIVTAAARRSCNFSLRSIEIILAHRGKENERGRERENPLSLPRAINSAGKWNRWPPDTRGCWRDAASRRRWHVEGTPEDWMVMIDLCLAAVAVDATRDSRGYTSRFFGTPPVNDLLSAASLRRCNAQNRFVNSPFFHTGCGWISTRIYVESLYLRRYGRGCKIRNPSHAKPSETREEWRM